jgi:predicted RNase H-like HicB family nuclease
MTKMESSKGTEMIAKDVAVQFTVDIIVEPDDGEFHAYCPALKGLHVGGRTEEEALQNATDAVDLYLKSLIKHGDPIPVGVATETITAPDAHRDHAHHTQRLAVSLDELQAAHVAL